MSINKSSSNLPKRSFRTTKIFKAEKPYTNEKVVTRPKNNFSIKDILISRYYKGIRKLTVLVNEENLKLGSANTNNNLFFPSLTGTYIDYNNLKTSWKDPLRMLKLITFSSII